MIYYIFTRIYNISKDKLNSIHETNISTLSLMGALQMGHTYFGSFKKQYLHILRCLQGFKITDLSFLIFSNLGL